MTFSKVFISAKEERTEKFQTFKRKFYDVYIQAEFLKGKIIYSDVR